MHNICMSLQNFKFKKNKEITAPIRVAETQNTDSITCWGRAKQKEF